MITIGQCWISEMEPELGLGCVVALEHRRVRIRFKAGECERVYAIASAPIKRVEFSQGDRIASETGDSFIIDKVEEKEGLLIYSGDGVSIVETDLDPHISFTTPETRLSGGTFDSNALFNMRKQALYSRHRLLNASVHGFVGGRIDLIPHQLYIAQEIANRKIPRALLADEVGLGKTIEACLVLHRLLVNGRISRVLILVPEVLVNQWFIELLRRFNLLFRIIDEDYMLDIEEDESEENPFETESLVICSNDFFEDEPERIEQVLDAGWDMLIVDEAHHLREGTDEYKLVKKLADSTPGLLLLTATPEQLGLYNHFERLRLLDSARYSDYETFVQASDSYHQIALLSNKILDKTKLTDKEIALLESVFDTNGNSIQDRIRDMEAGDEQAREKIVAELLDRHGIGRVMFRNTRKSMPDFPVRIVDAVALPGDSDLLQRLRTEFNGDRKRLKIDVTYEYQNDPRIDWIVNFLTEQPDEKLLLICRTRRKALALHEAIQKRINVKSALFHEGMSIIQRDRNAAWFSEADGARMLISSEIGSEGRNFQFAHHLVFVDLPVNPELLEQRIGRLDRIGQKSAINIHVLYVPGSPYGILFNWYQEGLNAFGRHVPGLYKVYEKFKSRLWDILQQEQPDADQIQQMITETSEYSRQQEALLEAGRDRLLEINSFRPEIASNVVQSIQGMDDMRDLDDLMHKIWDHYGINSEDVDINRRMFRLLPGDLKIDAFPGFTEKGMIVTFDRGKALEREDISFLSIDHPMVKGAIDLLLGSELGNSTIAIYNTEGRPGLLLEIIFVLECLAPQHLQVDRFLPPTPIRVVLDQKGQDKTTSFEEIKLDKAVKTDTRADREPDALTLKNEILPPLLERAEKLAESRASTLIDQAFQRVSQVLGGEVERLEGLSKINDHISPHEIELAVKEKKEINKYVKSARLRLDAMRIVIIGDWSE